MPRPCVTDRRVAIAEEELLFASAPGEHSRFAAIQCTCGHVRTIQEALESMVCGYVSDGASGVMGKVTQGVQSAHRAER